VIHWTRSSKAHPSESGHYLAIYSLCGKVSTAFFNNRMGWVEGPPDPEDEDEILEPLAWAAYNLPSLTKEEKKAEKRAEAERRKFRETIKRETDYCLPNLENECSALVRKMLAESLDATH